MNIDDAKLQRFMNLVLTGIGLAIFSSAALSVKATFAQGLAAGAKPVSTVAVSAPASWADIKDCSFEMRSKFYTGLTRLEARLDEQIRVLERKREKMSGKSDTAAWDFAMKEMGDARSALKSMDEECSKAGPEIWDQVKDKVGRAWLRAQEAHDKVKASTTN